LFVGMLTPAIRATFSHSLLRRSPVPDTTSAIAASRCQSVALSPEKTTNVKNQRLPAAAWHRRSISNWVFDAY
jgi:hypothetical protein